MELPDDIFELSEHGLALVSFTRATLRDSLTSLGRSSNWVGAMVRLFHRQFPLPYPPYQRSNFERAIELLREDGIASYLRAKGFRVVKLMDVPDEELIAYLEAHGYTVEGFMGNIYYSTLNRSTKPYLLPSP